MLDGISHCRKFVNFFHFFYPKQRFDSVDRWHCFSRKDVIEIHFTFAIAIRETIKIEFLFMTIFRINSPRQDYPFSYFLSKFVIEMFTQIALFSLKNNGSHICSNGKLPSDLEHTHDATLSKFFSVAWTTMWLGFYAFCILLRDWIG